MTKHAFWAILICLLIPSFPLFAEGITVSKTSGSNSFSLVSNSTAAQIVIDSHDAEVVRIAAEAFAGDLQLLTGIRPAIVNSITTQTPVIIGTLGQSSFIDQLATAGKINKSKLEGQWETFCVAVVNAPLSGIDKALVIAGSDPRGTAFGVFELSRLMGVSPWVWWADVTPEIRDAIYITGTDLFGPPSVKYRGMFINDEDWGMNVWAGKKMDTDIKNIGPRTHEKIFELMLRTKSNFFWPAMHVCSKAFWYFKTNPEIARKYSIVLGSSHCEQLLRNNAYEWVYNFSSEYPGKTRGDWNWKTNSGTIREYWVDRVKESKDADAIYTLGMRDVHDDAMQGYNSDKERAEALKDIIANQRNILKTYIGKSENTIPQLFCPYKEVLLQYNEGIDLPDDVTLLWPDDNHGFIRQLSTPQEQARSGGGGIYYHLSYLGPPRQDYLWLSSTSPVKISYEMSKAYDMNAKNIWMFNVGDLKPAEFEYQFAMDLAWDVDAWRPEKAHEYIRTWAEETFGSALAGAVAEIQSEHYRLSASGRPDQIDWVVYSTAEMEQRLAAYADLVNKVDALGSMVPERLKAAYFQLIVYPVEGAAAMNEKILGAKLSFAYAEEGKTSEAIELADRSKDAYRTIRDLTNTYNKVIADGKWDGIMSYAPVSRGFFYDPDVVSPETLMNDSIPAEELPSPVTVPAVNYRNKSAQIKLIPELGATGDALAVLPFDMTTYTPSNITSAPNAEYQVKLNKGNNRIRIMFLPTFPIYPGLDLRYAVSVDGATPVFGSIKRAENDSEWRTNVLRGYARGDVSVDSDSEKEVSVKVYFADPGLVLSGIEILQDSVGEYTAKLVNPDFETGKDGALEPGTLNRGTPYGWTQQGTLKGNSWGTNQDAVNFHGEHVCWYSSEPMPPSFQLSQTVKGLPAGEYVLRCRLGVPVSLMTNQRLFANKYVLYFGKEGDYAANLTAGEKNAFAGYAPEAESKVGTMMGLKEMALKFMVLPGEDVTLGIRSGNKLGDGSNATDRSGWFKVDYFRLECIRKMTAEDVRNDLNELIGEAQEMYNSTVEGSGGGQYSRDVRSAFQSEIQSAQTVSQNSGATMAQLVEAVEELKAAIADYKKNVVAYSSFIINGSFEHYPDGSPIDVTSGTDNRIVSGALRETPPGWLQTGEIKGTSFGINRDANNKDGNNVCWYKSTPMPENFELYQNISGLPAGKYTVHCKMAVPNGKLTTQRLFANNNVQYYGYSTDYNANIANGETYGFAGLETVGSNPYSLQEMEVNVVLAQGEELRLGVLSSNKKADGTLSSGDDGWFKIDDFRLELKELYDETGDFEIVKKNLFSITGEQGSCLITLNELFEGAHVRIFSLSGNIMYNASVSDLKTRIYLPQGLHIAVVSIRGEQDTCKVLVR